MHLNNVYDVFVKTQIMILRQLKNIYMFKMFFVLPEILVGLPVTHTQRLHAKIINYIVD